MPQHSPAGGLPRRPVPARSKGAALATALRALASFVALVALLAGLPLLLWWGTVVVAGPGIQALGSLLSTQDSGQVFLLALAVAGWIGWALFAASVVVELPAQLRGHTAPHLRLLVGQRAAATLVGAILLALPTGTALASSVAPAQAATATAHPGANSAQAQAGATAVAAPVSAQGPDGARTIPYTVRSTRPAESLWSIAHDRLGDGNLWEKIAGLNEGRTMTDGTVFHADAPIQPGWILQLPADATTAGAGVHTGSGHSDRSVDTEHTADYTVRPGDNLSQIAEDELGDAAQYPKIFALNEGQPQPHGLPKITDEDEIYPGQHLDIPVAAAPHDSGNDTTDDQKSAPPAGQDDTRHHTATPHATESPSTVTPTPSASAPAVPSAGATTPGTQDTDRPAATATPSPAQSAPALGPATTPDAQASPTIQPTLHGTRPTGSPTAVPAPAHATDDSGASAVEPVVLAAGIGALLAAGLAGGLGLRRILQQRHRRAGQRIAIDADPTSLEQVLHATAEPATVAQLDLALRTLASHAEVAGRPLPVVRGARVTDRSVQLILDDPATELLPPFAAGPAPGIWVLDPLCPLLSADAALEVPAPYPTLATLGTTADRHLVMANLAHTGVLLLDGDADDVLAVARALALEAASNGWSDHCEILTIGLGGRLARLLPQGRMRSMPHLPSVIADLGELLVEVHQQRDNGTGDTPDPLPWILICASEVDGEQAWQLADALSAARELPVTVVLPASEATRQAYPDADPLPVTPDATVTLPHLSPDPITLQRLTDDQYRQYLHTLQVADQHPQPATGAWQLAAQHDHAATDPRPDPMPLLLHQAGHTDGSSHDPGSPFPALLAGAEGSRIRLVKPTPTSDRTTTGPAMDTRAEPAPARTPDGDATAQPVGEPVAAAAGAAAEAAEDPDGPEVNVLGPVQVTGTAPSGHGPKVASLAALIYLRPGKTTETLCEAMDPLSPWSPRTLQSRLSEVRSVFGNNPQGRPYLPRPRDGYSFLPGVRSDWTRFQHLAAQGLSAGPNGTGPLEDAMALVRGRPFEGDYPWADALRQEMTSRIVDVAHHLATLHADADTPDLDAARHAVLRGLTAAETAEVLYRDWMKIEFAAGNTAGVHKAITRCQQVARSYGMDLESLTEQTIKILLAERPAPARAGRA